MIKQFFFTHRLTLTDTTAPGHGGPGSNGNQGVTLHSPGLQNMGQIDLFKNHLYSIGLCGKQSQQKTNTQKCKFERNMNIIP